MLGAVINRRPGQYRYSAIDFLFDRVIWRSPGIGMKAIDGLLLAGKRRMSLAGQEVRLHRKVVYDFSQWRQQITAPLDRMDARPLFTTLIAQNSVHGHLNTSVQSGAG